MALEIALGKTALERALTQLNQTLPQLMALELALDGIG